MTSAQEDGFPPGSGANGQGAPAIRWLAVAAWMGVIFLLSAQPGLRVSDDPTVDLPIRHVAHVAAFGVLGYLLINALAWAVPGRSVRWLAVAAVLLATLYGVSDEIHQSFVPSRNGNPFDVGLDAIGAAVGTVVWFWLARRRAGPGRQLRRGRTKAAPQASLRQRGSANSAER